MFFEKQGNRESDRPGMFWVSSHIYAFFCDIGIMR